MPAKHPVLKHLDSFIVTGFMVRTKNSDEFNPETAKLPNLWQQYYSNKPNPNETIFGVYSDYESDANGFYSLTAGVKSNNPDSALHTIKINSGKYLIFEGKGAMPQTVIETWGRVWEYFTEGSLHQRCFRTDFEVYSNGDDVSICIGVK